MVARRTQSVQPSQPVRFYKFVALTFLAITIILFGVIVFMSSKRAEIIITTKPETVDVTAQVGVNTGASVRSISGKIVSTVKNGQRVYTPTGDKEEPGIARGIVTLHNDTSIEQPLVATTRLLTEDGVLFRLDERVVVPANGTIDASVYADEEGARGNVLPSRFVIPGLSQAKQADIYATSDVSMTGGMVSIGIVSQDDIEKATKLLLEDVQEDARAELAGQAEGMSGVYDVVASDVTANVTVGDEVSEFTVTGTATVVGVFYNDADIMTLATDVLMSRAIDDAELIESSDAPPSVALASYDAEKETAQLDVTYAGRATINPESKQIAKTVLYGKTRDEVRRYLLSLDHVYGVDVKFRPAWTQTVPHVADHVDIVVKQVE